MESSHTGWWRRHGWTVALLFTAFGLTFALRSIWAYPIVAQWGPVFTYAGGSDSFYHSRVMEYIILNHRNLIHDPLLKFPFGAINPREPLFDWMNAILGTLFAPFFGGNALVAGAWFLDLQAPLWAALGVFPVYLIGREIAGRRTGLLAALIFPFLSANIDSTIFGYANYLSFYTFVILVAVYSFLRTVKAVGNRRWVVSYRSPRSVLAGLKGFLATERTAVKWAVFTGVSLGALALAWQGFTYAVVVIGISVLVAMVVERIRRVDSFGLYIATWIVGLVGFPMAMPYYIVQQQFAVWFDLPILLYFGILLLLLPFLFLRDVPWVFSLPLLVGLVAAAAAILAVVNPVYFTNIVTGQGYFVKNLIYSTVAEAQAPSIDQLIIGYGVVTFFLAFVGLALVVYQLVHGRFKRVHVVFLVFAILSIYLPISAAKFFEIGSPVFALLPAMAIVRALDLAGLPELRRTVASLADRRSQFAAFRRAFKVRHVVLLVVVVGLVLPNVWVAIDAGIPGNSKAQYSSQVASTLPAWLQPTTTNPSGYYFGAAGSSLDTPNQYDSAGYNWLAQQDTNLPPSERPAFVSWWDYGFQAIAQGNHPSVADNFQNGIDPAGQFLLSQNESQAIAVLTITLLQAEQRNSGLSDLPPALNAVLARDGVNLTELHTLLVNTSADYSLVVANPGRYLPVDPHTLTDDNAMYLATEYFLASALPLSGVAKVYNDVQAYTGWSIRYAMTDSRLFPFSGTNTGIFYAPADLTGRVINGAGLPVSFFNVTVLGSNGQSYPAGQVPAGVTPINYTLNQFAPFYRSMIYHIYVGYNGTQAGLGPGIPGLEGTQAVVNAPLMPGWMLQHFQVVYRTGYYCSEPNASAGSACFGAMNLPNAQSLASRTGGTADGSPGAYFSGGESMLEYYPGQPYLGTLTLPDGTPVGGARVTIDDGWGIPHMTTLTASDGTFSLLLPPGNDTLNVTFGTFDGLRQQGAQLLKSIPITVSPAVGMSFNAPPLIQRISIPPATIQGYVYWNANNSSGYLPILDPLVTGAQVLFWGSGNLSKLVATTDASGAFQIANAPPGLYDFNILYGGRNYSEGTATIAPGTPYNATTGLSPGDFQGTVRNLLGQTVAAATVTLGNSSGIVASTYSNLSGDYRIRSVGAGNYTLTATGPTLGWRSEGVTVSAATPGARVVANLTVRPTSLVTISVTAGGLPAAGIPVRFVPLAAYNASRSPLGSLVNASGQGVTLTTGADGAVMAALPEGTYSVYALGYVGSTLESGVTDLTVGPLEFPTATLAVAPALRLSGSVAPVGAPSASERTAVIAYAATGGEVVTWVTNGSYSFLLPAGSYSLLSLSGATSGPTSVSAALATATLTLPLTVPLSPVVAVAAQFTVGSPLGSGALFPAAGATVTVSIGSTGPAVPAVAGANGTVAFYVPSVLPGLSTYCVRAEAIGFVSANSCGMSPTGLASLSKLPLALANVAVSLQVVGLPSGVSVQVNLTAESATAVNRTLTGGPSFSFSSPPGVYGVGAYASIGNGTLYLPTSTLATTIPVGATYSNLTLYLLPQVFAKGTLELSGALSAARVNLTLSSPLLNISLNGSTYESGFYASPGTYSAYATATVSGTPYANLSRITIGTAGGISPPLVLNAAGVTVGGSLVNLTGSRAPVTTTVTLTGPNGALTSARATNGSFTVVLPANVSYDVAAHGTSLTPGLNGSFYQTWTTLAGASCRPTVSQPRCVVAMVPTTELVWLNGSLTSPGVPGTLAGAVTLLGPYPSLNRTTLAAPGGTFAAEVLPGAYDIYASGAGAGASRAVLSSALALPSRNGSVTLSLAPTWTATLQLAPPNGTLAGLGPVTAIVRDAYGHRLVYTGLSGLSSLSFALPTGDYSISASALGSLNGVASIASANATFSIVNGNVGVSLGLAYLLAPAVTGTIVGPTGATVVAGGSASFSFTVRNTGNVPVTVSPVGAPAYWTFDFSFASVSLAPGASTSGQVVLVVPAGTAVNHPTVNLVFVTSAGKVLGQVDPPPVVTVVGYYGVRLGTSSVAIQVGPHQVLAPFFVANTGNLAERVGFSVVDAARLAGLGWHSTVTNRGQGTATFVDLGVGDNQTFYVVLNATSSIFVPPGSVEIRGTVTNASGSVQTTAVIPISFASVSPKVPPGGSAIVVTGPSVGTSPASLPDWLIPLLSFVPAIALGAGLASLRWWRSRRWTRR